VSDVIERAEAALRNEELGAEVRAVIHDLVAVAKAGVRLSEVVSDGVHRRVQLIEDRKRLCDEVARLRASTIRAQVSEFHRVYGQPIGDKPCVPDEATVRLRARLIGEEFVEMLAAMFDIDDEVIGLQIRDIAELARVRVNLPELVDAWGDLDYVVEGSRLAFGVDGAPVAAEIQRSNLSKLGADGKPIRREDGKTLKGPNYSPPDLVSVLRAQGWEG
jgi:predicted HAD superfamily Cof-like phosphohydrolase